MNRARGGTSGACARKSIFRPTNRRHEAIDERKKIGLARDAGLGKNMSQMSPRSRCGNAEGFGSFSKRRVSCQILEHPCFRRRKAEVSGKRPDVTGSETLRLSDKDSGGRLRHHPSAQIAACKR